MTGSHPNRSRNEDGLSSDLVDVEDGGDRSEEHDNAGDDNDQRRRGRREPRRVSVRVHFTSSERVGYVPDDSGSEQADRVSRQAEPLEDLRSVVEYSVDAGPLLEEHSSRGDHDSTEVNSVGDQAEERGT
jgi:hypothetical protein